VIKLVVRPLTKRYSRWTVDARPPSKFVIGVTSVATGRFSQFASWVGVGMATSPKYA
jgi:hypothetical protein